MNTVVSCHFLLQGYSQPKNQTCISCITRGFLTLSYPGSPLKGSLKTECSRVLEFLLWWTDHICMSQSRHPHDVEQLSTNPCVTRGGFCPENMSVPDDTQSYGNRRRVRNLSSLQPNQLFSRVSACAPAPNTDRHMESPPAAQFQWEEWEEGRKRFFGPIWQVWGPREQRVTFTPSSFMEMNSPALPWRGEASLAVSFLGLFTHPQRSRLGCGLEYEVHPLNSDEAGWKLPPMSYFHRKEAQVPDFLCRDDWPGGDDSVACVVVRCRRGRWGRSLTTRKSAQVHMSLGLPAHPFQAPLYRAETRLLRGRGGNKVSTVFTAVLSFSILQPSVH